MSKLLTSEVIFEMEAPYLGTCQLRATRIGEGPAQVAVVAGIHGNEVTAIHAANLLIERLSLFPGEVPCVLVLSCVNEAGAMLGVKRWPFDEADLQEVFPGDALGMASARLAAAVVEVTKAPLGIELQTGSEVLEEVVHTRGSVAAPGATETAIWWKDAGSSGLTSCWQERGQRTVEVRGGRAGSLDPMVARSLAELAERVILRSLENHPFPEASWVTSVELRADHAGFFVPWVQVGQQIQANTPVGEIRPLIGYEPGVKVYSPEAGIVMAIRCYPTVYVRELLVRIGSPTT